MAHRTEHAGSIGVSLVGLELDKVRGWIEDYIDRSHLTCSADSLMAAASHIEGTSSGITRKGGTILHKLTRTKLRKARSRILSGK